MDDSGRRRLGIGLATAGLACLAFAYRDLLSLGPRYGGVQSGVEYWLFVPNDRAPAVVLALSAWLAWRRWPRLRRLPLQAAPLPWVVLALSLGALSYGWSIHVRAEDLQAISLIANLAGLIGLRWGLPGLRAMWLPLAFLLFCVPIPSPLLVTLLWELRLITAEYTGWLLYLLGIPSLVSGDQVLRATQTFQVIEGCSGLRSAETLTMLVVLLVDLFGRRGGHAAILLLTAPFVAFGLNGLRVLTLVLNPHSEIVGVHSLQGIAILLVGLLGIYFLDGLLAWGLPKWGGGHPEAEPPSGSAPAWAISGKAFIGILLGVGLGTAAAGWLTPTWSAPRHGRTLEDHVGEALGDLSYEDIDPEIYFLGRTYFAESIHRSYATRAIPVEVFIGSSDLRDRRTSVVSRITGFPGSGWEIRDRHVLRLGEDGPEATALIIEKGAQRRLAYHWRIGVGGLFAETLRSFLGLERSEFRRTHGQLAVRLSTSFAGSGEQRGIRRAEERLMEVYEKLDPALRAASWPEPGEQALQEPAAAR